MSIKGGFFESKLLAGVYDRSYGASEYAERWGRFVGNGVSVVGGGLLTTENAVSIVTDTMKTQVAIGGGYVNGYVYEVDAPSIVTHAAADPTNPRIDRVVIELNLLEATRAFVVKAIAGTPAVSPTAPALTRTADVWQISLAQVLVPANVVVLNTGTVTDERSDAALCGVANVKLGITPPSGDAEVLKNTIGRLIEDDTGAANAYVVDTVGTFEVVQGNPLAFLAANSNTGASTIAVDGQLLTIKSVDDTGAKIDPEASTILAGQLVRGYIDSGFFVLAPKGGANPLSKWNNPTVFISPTGLATATTSRVAVSGSGWVISATNWDSAQRHIALKIDGAYIIGDAANSIRMGIGNANLFMIRFETSFEFFADGTNRVDLMYCLGDKYEEAELKAYKTQPGVNATLLKTSVTGSGWLYGISLPYAGGVSYRVVIDGVQIFNTVEVTAALNFFIRFNSSFQIYSSNVSFQIGVTYTLD